MSEQQGAPHFVTSATGDALLPMTRTLQRLSLLETGLEPLTLGSLATKHSSLAELTNL